MSLPAPYQEHYYIADGVTTSFSFGEYFTAPASANVKCIVYFEDGTSSVPAFTVNIVTGFINITALTTPDGQVLNAPPAGSSVRVFRDTPEQQNVTASQIQNYTAKQLEKIFDSIVAMIQEVSYSDKHKTLRLTETQRDVFLSFLKEANDDALLYWDNESKTITPTDFVRQDIVRMSGGLFFRMKHDAKLRPYLEWSKNGQTDWNSLNLWAQVDTANEAKENADEALTIAQSVQGDLSSHTTDLNNPHATSIGNLTDTDINAPTVGQFMKYDGSKWVNSDSSASVSFDGIEGDPYDNTALADALNNKANSSDVYTKNEIDTALNNKANSSDVYTKNEIDTALNNKANKATTLGGYNISDAYTKSEVDTIANGKANTDLSNLTAKGKNISNWSSNVSNCITEIPQDIKLELNNGTLTLKAGSKIYVPNGVGNFDELVIQNDLTTITTWGEQTQLGLFVKSDGSTMFIINMEERCSSGSTPPTATNIQMWYDTTNNLVKRYASGADTGDRYSLPIALVQKGDAVESSNISSIDQVFNGFGYIGSTVFALPGVKGLIPNGRNEDGSLKNTEITENNVITQTQVVTNAILDFVIRQDGASGGISELGWNYNEAENQIYNSIGKKANWIPCARFSTDSNTKITSFTPRTAFHAVDYSDTEYIAHQAMPSGGFLSLTVGAHGASYIAPADGYFSLIYSGSVTTNLGLMSNITGATSVTKTDGGGGRFGVYISVSKGESIQAFHYGVSSGLSLRFIYANGSK